MKLLKIVFFTLLIGCSSPEVKNNSVISDSKDAITVNNNDLSNLQLRKLEKLLAVGDFNGDDKKDTIFQHAISGVSNSEIDLSPDPFKNDWELVEEWFYDNNVDICLTRSDKKNDTLQLGIAQGLYCLINIGDNNSDGKDEFAYVIDNLDLSRVNSCKIYTVCKNKWALLFEFGIHEDAFDYVTNETPTFNNIKGYLEKQKGKWTYLDYSQNDFENEDEVGKMKVLKLNKCEQ